MVLCHGVYPVPQNATHVPAHALAGGSTGMNPVRSQLKPRPQSYGVNVLDLTEGPHPKATDVSPWYGVYREAGKPRAAEGCVRVTRPDYYSG